MSASPMSPDEIRAVAEVHQELGPDYSAAVVESFLEKIEQEIGARIDARIADLRLPADVPQPRRVLSAATMARRRTFLAGAAIGALGAGTPLTLFAFGLTSQYGGNGWLAAIWLVIAAAFIAGMAGAGALRLTDPHHGADETEH